MDLQSLVDCANVIEMIVDVRAGKMRLPCVCISAVRVNIGYEVQF